MKVFQCCLDIEHSRWPATTQFIENLYKTTYASDYGAYQHSIRHEEKIKKWHQNNKHVEPTENPTTQAQALSVEMAQMMGNPERVLPNYANPYFLTTFHLQGRAVQEHIDILDDAIDFDNAGPPSISEQGTTPAPVTSLKFLKHPRLRAEMPQIVQKEARRTKVL